MPRELSDRDALNFLQRRITEGKRQAESLRTQLAAAEAKVTMWEGTLESAAKVLGISIEEIEAESGAIIEELSPQDMKTRTTAVRTALDKSTVPLSGPEIVKRTHELVGRSTVYWCLKNLLRDGLVAKTGRKYYLTPRGRGAC